MKKILFSITIFMILAATILTGCSSNTSQPSSDTPSNPEKPFAGTTVRFLTISGHEYGLDELLPEFEAETGINVEVASLSMPDALAKVDIEFGAGTSSFDVLDVMWEMAQGYARGGHLLYLDEYMEEYDVDTSQYVSVFVNKHMIQYPETADGKYVDLPYLADIQFLAYRADLFEDPEEMANFKAKYGYDLAPPTTFDQFDDIAEFFTRDTDGDGNNDLFGTVVMGGNHPALCGDVMPYLHGYGADYLDADYRPIINSPEAVAALQRYYDLYLNGWTPPAASTYTFVEENADFQNGKIAMMVIWTNQVAPLEDPSASQVADKIKYAMVQGGAPSIGGWALAIPKYSKNQEAAFVFANWLTSDEVALARARTTGLSTAGASSYTDPVMTEKYKHLDTVNESWDNGIPHPQIGEISSLMTISVEELSRVFTGEITVQEAADNMQERLDKAMRESGYYE